MNVQRKHVTRATLAVLAGLALSSSPEAQRAGRAIQSNLEFEGIKREFGVYLPSVYDPQKPLPVIFALHGGGGNGKKMAAITDFNRRSEREGFIVIYPNGIATGENPEDRYWNTGSPNQMDNPDKANLTTNDVGFFGALIEHVTKNYAVDAKRVYFAGFSNGAGMSYSLACAHADKIAAIVAVGSGLSVECQPSSPVGVLQIIGTTDPHWIGQDEGIRKGVDVFAQANACDSVQTQTQGRVTRESHAGCAANTAVEYLRLEGVDHHWPGSDKSKNDPLVASDVAWTFLSRHIKP